MLCQRWQTPSSRGYLLVSAITSSCYTTLFCILNTLPVRVFVMSGVCSTTLVYFRLRVVLKQQESVVRPLQRQPKAIASQCVSVIDCLVSSGVYLP